MSVGPEFKKENRLSRESSEGSGAKLTDSKKIVWR